MANRQPRAPRNNKAKEVKPETPVAEVKPAAEVVAVSQVAEVVAEQVAKVEPDVGAVPEVKTPKAKKLVSAGISSARTRRHIDRLGINLPIELELVKYKKNLDALKHAEALIAAKKVTEAVTVEVDGKNKTEQRTRDATAEELAAAAEAVRTLSATKSDNKMHVTALSRERTRFSNESAAVLSFVCEEIVDSLVEHTMDAAIADSKVTIQVAHLHSAGVEALPLAPLFSSLPKFKSTAAKYAKAAEDAAKTALVESTAAATEKKFRERYASYLPKEQKVAKAKPTKPTDAAETDDAADNKVSFKFYVVHACDRLKASEKYAGKNIKISNDIKTYLSDLIIEFIGRVANLVVLTVNSMKNTTVTDVAIMRTIEALLIDGHKPTESIQFSIGDIKDPAFIEAEAEKRKLDPTYKVNTEVPLVKGPIAAKVTVYPTSYYDTLATKVAEKLSEYKKKPPVEADAEDDAAEDAAEADAQ